MIKLNTVESGIKHQ